MLLFSSSFPPFFAGDTIHSCRVLDECDEMLNMGFVDDVETILGAASKNADGSVSAAAGPGRNASGETLQTLLFSATMPVWVKDITRRFLVQDHQLVDLVGDDKLKVRRSLLGRRGAWWVIIFANGMEGHTYHACVGEGHHTTLCGEGPPAGGCGGMHTWIAWETCMRLQPVPQHPIKCAMC